MKGLQKLLALPVFLFATSGWAAIQLPALLSSHMVLQRGVPVPIWGTADPNETVTIKFRDQEKSAVADAQTGKWMVKLDQLSAGGPGTLTLTGSAKAEIVKLEDVLVGEVWVGAGEGNMDLAVADFAKSDEGLAAMVKNGPYPQLRAMRSGEAKAGWQQATPEHIGGFSALLFSFGLALQKKMDVPVGLILAAEAATPASHWISQNAYATDQSCRDALNDFAANDPTIIAQKTYAQTRSDWLKLTPAEQKKKPLPQAPPAPAKKPGDSDNKAGLQYEVEIRPLIPYAIRGVLWDQGESGTGIYGLDEFALMGALIAGWRADWGQGDFPFLYVQKPNGGGLAWDASDPLTMHAEKFAPLPASVPEDGTLRDDFEQISWYPQTTMVDTSDLMPGNSPTDKSSYGLRAAQVALDAIYGTADVSGPTYESHTVRDGKIAVRFSHVGTGLTFKDGEKLQGFAIAGADKKFFWADAEIEAPAGPNAPANVVVLSNPAVPKPLFVRYAWSKTHPWANLFNQEGKPAQAFRTDDWSIPIIQ